MSSYSSNSDYSSSDDEDSCTRCGRVGHVVDECFAKTDVNGRHLKRARYDASKSEFSCKKTGAAGVYVLGDQKGRMYVGKSQDVENRIEQHLQGKGNQFLSGRVKRLEVEQTGSTNDLESWERNETLARMYKYGVANVRGWMFTSVKLNKSQEEEAFRQICEKYDLCRKCGRNSHFADKCFARSRAFWADMQ
jgi:predicted GIY-YIG superfamily endonuclease